MIYVITTDCRIANKDYKKGELVTVAEIGQYYPSIMKPAEGPIKPKKVEKAKDQKAEETKADNPEENADAETVEDAGETAENPR